MLCRYMGACMQDKNLQARVHSSKATVIPGQHPVSSRLFQHTNGFGGHAAHKATRSAANLRW